MATDTQPTAKPRPIRNNDTCDCDRPILRERAAYKGGAETWCGRCGNPVPLTLAKRES